MAALTGAKAQTVRALAIDAIDRNCLLLSMHAGNSRQIKRQRTDSNNERSEKRLRSEKVTTIINPVSDSSGDSSKERVTVDTITKGGDRKEEEHHQNASKNDRRASRTRQDKQLTGETTTFSNNKNSNRKRSSSGNVIQLCPSSSSSSSSCCSSSSSDSDSSVSALGVQNEIPSIVRSSNAHTPPQSIEKVSVRRDECYDNDPFERNGQDEVDYDSVQGSSRAVGGLQLSTVQCAANQNDHGPNFPLQEDSILMAESGRSEMPLKLDTAMVMSDDSASYGDNRSELDWNSDKDGGNNESRTNMNIGSNLDAI